MLALGQGCYFAVTGIWPLVHVRSFMAVTGPKHDVWLVRTVGVLVLGIGIAIGTAGRFNHLTPELRFLALFSAAALAAVDLLYVAVRVIPRIYLLDAAIELVLIALWVWLMAAARP
jgi:hypothetical protein